MVLKVKTNKIMAINGIATIEQSKKLIELGIDVSTADMTWEKVAKSLTEDFYWKSTIGLDRAIKDNLFSYRNGHILPCWSLAALIELMPEHIVINNKVSNSLKMDKEEGGIGFCYFFGAIDKVDNIVICGMKPIDAAFEMVCYLLKNKLI